MRAVDPTLDHARDRTGVRNSSHAAGKTRVVGGRHGRRASRCARVRDVALLLRNAGQEARSPCHKSHAFLFPRISALRRSLATDYAIDMAFRYGASIRLVHVLEDLYLAGFPDGYVDLSGLKKQQEDDAARPLSPARARSAKPHVSKRRVPC